MTARRAALGVLCALLLGHCGTSRHARLEVAAPRPTRQSLARNASAFRPRPGALDTTPRSTIHDARLRRSVLVGEATPVGVEAREAPAFEPSLHYRLSSDAALQTLSIQTCFEGQPPPWLSPGIARASMALLGARDSDGAVLSVVDGRIDLRSLGRDACMTYRLDVDRARSASRFSGRYGRDVVTSAGAFLWRDLRRTPRGGATARFDLPPGLSAAVPWPRQGSVYRLDASAFRRASFIALGELHPVEITRQGARVRAVRLGPDPWTLDDAGLRRWLETAVDGISTVQGRFPVEDLLIVLAPLAGRGMGFGMVRRGGGHAVGFQMGRRSTFEDLTGSWVSWHELSHLQLPALPQRDAWLYEGLATYYQEVVAARMGFKSEADAWGALRQGFERGSNSRARGPLSEAAEGMMQTGAFSRVYWSGTAFALEADLALRANGSSLDEALTRAAPSWRGSTRLWNSDEVCAAWDRPLDSDVLGALRSRYAAARRFPEVGPALSQLGVPVEGAMELDDAAELSAVRQSIMRRPDQR
ncbi:MAG: hypothetical protein AB8I08_01535 [Sandaracinaceae bacterium]